MAKDVFKTPQKIPILPEKLLVICLAHRYANVYQFHSRQIKKLEPIHTQETDISYSDKEGFSYISRSAASDGGKGEGTIPGAIENDESHYLNIFLNYFAKEVKRLFTEGHYTCVVIFSPEDIKNTVIEKFEPHLAEKIEFIMGNFTKHQPIELVEKIYDEKPHLFLNE